MQPVISVQLLLAGAALLLAFGLPGLLGGKSLHRRNRRR